MAASVRINEYNKTTETVANNPTNLNFGSFDTYNLVTATYPLAGSGRSFEKWVKLDVYVQDSTIIDNIKVWIPSDTNPTSNCTIYTNCTTTGYDGAETYNTTTGPLASDRSTTYNYEQIMDDSVDGEPTGANLGIGGLLTGSYDSSTGESDYCIMQAVTSSATVGDSITIRFAYDETA